ncbi:MAG: redox-sensing transcriptional repressor Rex [Clostridia bacterium]|nr:redox-sensing transcriptional repressor Rex [Clostridia bacterium]
MEKKKIEQSCPKKLQAREASVSPAVIKRLPRYFRYLRVIMREGIMRISSSELSERMDVTASQIRQDLNCFGGFGQQGYGYNVPYLYAKICEILGVGEGYTAIVVGAGNLGSALVRSPMFERRGVNIAALFDVDPARVGKKLGDIPILSMTQLESFCARHSVDVAVLTLPKDCTREAAARIAALGIRGIWNLTGLDLENSDGGPVVENVHIGDSLMTLCYEIHRLEGREERV